MRTSDINLIDSTQKIVVKTYIKISKYSEKTAKVISRIAAGILYSPAAALNIVFHTTLILPTFVYAIGKSIYKKHSDFSLPIEHILRVKQSVSPLLYGSIHGFIKPFTKSQLLMALMRQKSESVETQNSNQGIPVQKTVVIVGAGPVGITLACTLKSLNPTAKITVIDAREKPGRTHGLSIGSESIDMIKDALSECSSFDAEFNIKVQKFREIIDKWSGHFIRTNEIEMQLAEHARELGVEVLRGESYKVSDGDLDTIMSAENPAELSDKQKGLHALLNEASVVIGCDGAHSVVREELGIKKVDQQTLGYMVELKYETNGNTHPRTSQEAAVTASVTGFVSAEIVNRNSSEGNKPATLLTFVSKAVFDKLRPTLVDNEGVLKRTLAKTWTLQELHNLSKTDKDVNKLYLSLMSYLHNKDRSAEKVSTIELAIYRSESSVVNYRNKQFMLVGDANSGFILQRGFNKGLKEVALCAMSITNLFKKCAFIPERSIPIELRDYQDLAYRVFKAEKKTVEWKNLQIEIAKFAAETTSSFKRSN